MLKWKDRPAEVANLLNPAFCGEILVRCIKEFQSIGGDGFPYPLLFLVLPVILHCKTREAIIPSKRSKMHVWIQNNQHLRIGFSERAKNLVPITKEAIAFLLQVGVVKIDNYANLTINKEHNNTINVKDSKEIIDCFKKAKLIGGWFAKAGSPANIYLMWGVQP